MNVFSLRRLIWLLPVIVIGGGSLVNYRFSAITSRELADLSRITYPTVLTSQALIFDLDALQEILKGSVAAGDRTGIETARTKAEAFRTDLTTLSTLPGSAAAAAAIQNEFEPYNRSAQEAASILLGVSSGDVSALAPSMQSHLSALTARLEANRASAHESLDDLIAHSRAGVSRGLAVSVGVTLLILCASAAAAGLSVLAVRGQLGGDPEYAKGIVQRVADGNLNSTVALRPHDQNSLLFAMNSMQRRLSSVLLEVRLSVNAVSTSAAELAGGNSDLSERTSRQSSSLETAAHRLKELADTVKSNADSALRANTLVGTAAGVAQSGGAAVGAVVDTMEAINNSSKRIVDIIEVIDGIAFQTNLLALNAAVEAARAGDQGRGFAVVATEVRALAQRSAAAAKEISRLIGGSVAQVQEGLVRVRTAGTTMNEIVTSVGKVSDLIAHISSASTQQSANISGVSKDLETLEHSTFQNASLVEQAAAATTQLEQLAQRVARAIGVFQLAGQDNAPVIIPAARVPILLRHDSGTVGARRAARR